MHQSNLPTARPQNVLNFSNCPPTPDIKAGAARQWPPRTDTLLDRTDWDRNTECSHYLWPREAHCSWDSCASLTCVRICSTITRSTANLQCLCARSGWTVRSAFFYVFLNTTSDSNFSVTFYSTPSGRIFDNDSNMRFSDFPRATSFFLSFASFSAIWRPNLFMPPFLELIYIVLLIHRKNRTIRRDKRTIKHGRPNYDSIARSTWRIISILHTNLNRKSGRFLAVQVCKHYHCLLWFPVLLHQHGSWKWKASFLVLREACFFRNVE